MLSELGLDAAWGAVFLGVWASVMLCAGIGVVAWVSRRRNTDPSDLTALFQADTAQFPRDHFAQHRRPRSWGRLVQHRRPVCRPQVPAGQRNTVRVQTFDPPEGRRG